MGKKLKIENGNKKEKFKLFMGGSTAFEESILKGARIELNSNTQAVIEGCQGVIEYNENYLKLRLSQGAIALFGNDFDIVSFEEKTICIKGKINSLEFAV